jgi:hypothetical protein
MPANGLYFLGSLKQVGKFILIAWFLSFSVVMSRV